MDYTPNTLNLFYFYSLCIIRKQRLLLINKQHIEKLRKQYIKNSPEGMDTADILLTLNRLFAVPSFLDVYFYCSSITS